MNYDFTNAQDRKRFVKRANALLKSKRNNVCLVDESNRTPNQNSYLHVLIRIVADYTGETEYYAKQVYFKQLANPGIFCTVTKDTTIGKVMKLIRSTAELDITEMRRAIEGFHVWVRDTFDGRLILPEATLADDGSVVFKSQNDALAYHQAQVHTSKEEMQL